MTDAKTVLAEMLDWLAQHGLDGPTDTGDLMHRAYDALAASEARVEALEYALRDIASVRISDAERLGAMRWLQNCVTRASAALAAGQVKP